MWLCMWLCGWVVDFVSILSHRCTSSRPTGFFCAALQNWKNFSHVETIVECLQTSGLPQIFDVLKLIWVQTSSTVNKWIDTLQSFESLLLSQCYRHVTWKNILADVSPHLKTGIMERQRQNLASGFESLALSQCSRHDKWKNILANIFKKN